MDDQCDKLKTVVGQTTVDGRPNDLGQFITVNVHLCLRQLIFISTVRIVCAEGSRNGTVSVRLSVCLQTLLLWPGRQEISIITARLTAAAAANAGSATLSAYVGS